MIHTSVCVRASLDGLAACLRACGEGALFVRRLGVLFTFLIDSLLCVPPLLEPEACAARRKRRSPRVPVLPSLGRVFCRVPRKHNAGAFPCTRRFYLVSHSLPLPCLFPASPPSLSLPPSSLSFAAQLARAAQVDPRQALDGARGPAPARRGSGVRAQGEERTRCRTYVRMYVKYVCHVCIVHLERERCAPSDGIPLTRLQTVGLNSGRCGQGARVVCCPPLHCTAAGFGVPSTSHLLFFFGEHDGLVREVA